MEQAEDSFVSRDIHNSVAIAIILLRVLHVLDFEDLMGNKIIDPTSSTHWFDPGTNSSPYRPSSHLADLLHMLNQLASLFKSDKGGETSWASFEDQLKNCWNMSVGMAQVYESGEKDSSYAGLFKAMDALVRFRLIRSWGRM